MTKLRFLYVFMANTLLGLSGIIIAQIKLPSEQVLFFTGIVAFFILQLFNIFQKRRLEIFKVKLNKNFLYYIFIVGFLGWFLFSAFGDLETSPVTTSLIVNSTPFLVCLLAPVVLKEKVSLPEVFISLFGIFALGIFITGGDISSLKSSFSTGLIFAISALLISVVFSIFNKKVSINNSTLFIPYGVAIGNMVVGLIFWILNPEFIKLDKNLFYIFLLGLNTFLGFYFLSLSFRKLSLTTVSIFGLLQPIVALAFSLIFFKEKLNSIKFIGGFLVLTTIFLQILANHHFSRIKKQ